MTVEGVCAGDSSEGRGYFLGRPGRLLFVTATLSGGGTIFCCPQFLELTCKPAVIERKRERVMAKSGWGISNRGK